MVPMLLLLERHRQFYTLKRANPLQENHLEPKRVYLERRYSQPPSLHVGGYTVLSPFTVLLWNTR
jgi:hypothetical protein